MPRDRALAKALADWAKGQEERSRGLAAQPGASAHYVEAERLGRSALASYERWLPPDDPRIADVLDLLGYVEDEVGEFGRGALRFERALSLRRSRGAEAVVIARTTSDLGWLRLLHGQSREAEAAFREALSMAPDRTGARQGLAQALAALGQLEAAEREALAARAAREAELGAASPALAGDLLFLASIARRQGRLDRCEERIRKAEPSIGPGHSRARLLEEKGALALARGNAGEAETAATEARRLRAAAFGPRHPAQVRALVLSARALQAEGRPAEAAAALAEVRDLASRFLAPTHPVFVELAELEGTR
jgi:tetratricopeptide (TPR) repeat protein